VPPGQPRVCRVERCDYQPEKGWFETVKMEMLVLG